MKPKRKKQKYIIEKQLQNNKRQVPLQPRFSVQEPNIHKVPNISDNRELKQQVSVDYCVLPLRG